MKNALGWAWQKDRFRRTTLLTFLFGSILVGLAIVQAGIILHVSWAVFALIILIVSYRQKNFISLLTILLFGLCLGNARGAAFEVKTDAYDTLFGKKVIMVGHAKTDAVYGKQSQLSFDMHEFHIEEPREEDLVGIISVSGFGEKAVYRGDLVRVEGKLQPTRGSKQARMSFAQIDVVQHKESATENIRRNFVAGMYSAVSEPEASFGLGLLIGQRTTLPEEVADTLKIVGLTHIIAVSGYNLTILVRAAQRGFAKRSKYQAVLASSILIIGFLLITGLSASIVRAAIVSGLGLIAWYFGRQFRPTLLLLLTAAITAMWYPIYLWSDIGWYLSFLAFYGVLVVAPLVVIRIWKTKETGNLRQIVVESICAQIMTLPLIMWIFGQASLIGLMANVLVVPIVPIAMLFSAIAGLAGMLTPSIAGWFAWPAQIVLTYILDVAQLLSKVPHALVQAKLSLFGMLFLYGLLFVCVAILMHKTKNAILTDKEN